MKKVLTTLALSVAMTTTLSAQTKVSEKMTVYELDNSKLHVFQTGDAMGDVSFIIEGDKKLVILEQPLFWDNINEFNAYVKNLGKPIDKVIANYHSLGLADYAPNSVMMPTPMIEFNNSDAAKGMIAHFEKSFGEAADFRPHKKAKGFEVASTQNWADVKMVFSAGVESDFPAANILIDNKAFYTHFAPSKSHANPMQIKSREALAANLAALKEIKASGVEFIFGSHGPSATMAEVDFQIEYLEKITSLLAICDNSDTFSQRLLLSYPYIPGVENIKTIAKALYPNEKVNPAKEQVRERMQDYFNMVSNLDETIAKGLWAKEGNISIITPRGHFFGLNSIMNDFLKKAFSSFKYRKLSSLSEVINVYGNSANVQLYWNFDTIDAKGEKHQDRGRESLIFEKIDNEWRLVHVHYSPMPVKQRFRESSFTVQKRGILNHF